MKIARIVPMFAVAAVVAAAGPVHAAVYTYDFNGLTTGSLKGQDNWTSDSVGGTAVRSDPQLNNGGQSIWINSDSASQTLVRQNDTNFSYSIPNGSIFTIEFDLILGNASQGGRVGLVDSSGNRIFDLGNNNSGNFNMIDATGHGHAGSDQGPTGADAQYHLIATINLAAYDGNGSFSLSVSPVDGLGGWSTPVAVTGLQNVDMQLGDIDGSDFAGLYVTVFRNGGLDTIKITTGIVLAPAPAALPAGLGLLGVTALLARRRR